MEIVLSNQKGLKILREQSYITIHYQDEHYDDTLQICNDLLKEICEKLVDSIFEAFQIKESKQ